MSPIPLQTSALSAGSCVRVRAACALVLLTGSKLRELPRLAAGTESGNYGRRMANRYRYTVVELRGA
jgi:hypothetical protein